MQRQYLTVVAQPSAMALLHEMAAHLGPSTLAFASTQSCSDGRELLSGLVLPAFALALAAPDSLARAMAPVLELSAGEAFGMLADIDVSSEQAAEVMSRLGIEAVPASPSIF